MAYDVSDDWAVNVFGRLRLVARGTDGAVEMAIAWNKYAGPHVRLIYRPGPKSHRSDTVGRSGLQVYWNSFIIWLQA